MSRIEPLQTASLDIYPLSSSASRKALFVFAELLSSCAGPHGRNHVIRNTCGGHMTITSSCSRILSSTSLSRSELKLVSSAITGHLQQHGDCGLFMAHMCLQLTKSTLDLEIHHRIAASIFQSFVSIIVDYIKSDNCDVTIKADFSNVNVLLGYVRSILTSKSLLNIEPQELNNCCLTVLNAFVKAIPSVPVQRYSCGIYVLGMEKQSIKNCKSVDGIMLEFPELSIFGNLQELALKMEEKFDGHIKVSLITCSMSGDMEEIVTATFEATEKQFSDMEECIIEKMMTLCNAMEKENVGLVLCQKVIHPRIKAFLMSKGIVFIDRLGSQPIPFIRDLTGCQPITSVLQNIQGAECLGRLTSVTPCFESSKNYIRLQNDSAAVMTLVVCAEFEERLSELKHCVSTCLQGLEALAKEPRLLMGGGCWQMHCSHILKEKVLSTLPEMCNQLRCTKSTLRQLLTIFRSCLHQWCLNLKHEWEHLSFDQSSLHCWRVCKNIPVNFSNESMIPCGCGFKAMPFESLRDLDIVLTQDDHPLVMNTIKDSPCVNVREVEGHKGVVLDSFTACVEALYKGVLTASLLLSVGQFICDKN